MGILDRESAMAWLATNLKGLKWPTGDDAAPPPPCGWEWGFDINGACVYLRETKMGYREYIYQLEFDAWYVQNGAPRLPLTGKHDAVKSPKHYLVMQDIEAIDVIAGSMTEEMFKGYCFGNNLKYRLRVGKKDSIEQEVGKAMEYEDLFEKWKHLCRK